MGYYPLRENTTDMLTDLPIPIGDTLRKSTSNLKLHPLPGGLTHQCQVEKDFIREERTDPQHPPAQGMTLTDVPRSIHVHHPHKIRDTAEVQSLSACNVCMIIDLEGFFINGTFEVRELGFYTWKGCHGRFAFKPTRRWDELSPKDRKTVSVVKYHVNGLTYFPRKDENALNQDSVKKLVNYLYQRNGDEGREFVAYKGGHVERDLLESLYIPHVNLERFGCPKYEKILPSIIEPLKGCSFHTFCDKAHCGMAECHAFWLWMITYM